MATVFLVAGCVTFIVFAVCWFQWQTADQRGRSSGHKRVARILTIAALLIAGICLLLFLQAQPKDAAALLHHSSYSGWPA